MTQKTSYIIGLTGGIGSGKTAAAKHFAARGVPVIDADKIGHALIAERGAAEKTVIEHFGSDIVCCGKIDRSRLASIVFSDKNALEQLNAIVHPLLFEEIQKQCRHYATCSQAPVVIVDAALLGESGQLHPWLDGLILLICATEERIRRLVLTRGMTEQEARNRIGAQYPPEKKQGLADWIIENEGTLDSLYQKVDHVIEALYDRFG